MSIWLVQCADPREACTNVKWANPNMVPIHDGWDQMGSYRKCNEDCTFSRLWVAGRRSSTSRGTRRSSASSELWWWCSSLTAYMRPRLLCCVSSWSSYCTCSRPHVRPTGAPSHRLSSSTRWLRTVGSAGPDTCSLQGTGWVCVTCSGQSPVRVQEPSRSIVYWKS